MIFDKRLGIEKSMKQNLTCGHGSLLKRIKLEQKNLKSCQSKSIKVTCGSLSKRPAVCMSSHPIKRKSNSSSNKRPSCIDGVGKSFSFGNNSILRLIFRFMGGAVGAAAAAFVACVVELFTALFKLTIAFVVSLLFVVLVSVCGGVVDVGADEERPAAAAAALAAATAAFKFAVAVFGVFVLTTAVPDENEDNVESNDEDFILPLICLFLYLAIFFTRNNIRIITGQISLVNFVFMVVIVVFGWCVNTESNKKNLRVSFEFLLFLRFYFFIRV